MTALNKSEPPAWAVNLGLTLEDMANQNQILQAVLEMAATNCQLQGNAAQAQAEAAANIADNQSEQTMQDAYTSILEGSFGIGSSVLSGVMEVFAFKSSIKEAQTSNQCLSSYENGLNEAGNPSKVMALKELDADGKWKIGDNELTNAKQELFGKNIEKEAATDDDIQNLALLKSGDEKSYDEFTKKVQNKIKKNDRLIQSLQSKKSSYEQMLQSMMTGISKASSAQFSTQKANAQETSAGFQYVQALAQYLSQATNAAGQTIMGQKDQIFNLMMSTAQELIGGMAQANQVR